MQAPTRFPLGDATISVLHLGDLRVRLADWLRLAETDWHPEHRPLFADLITVPVQCVHIALPGRSVLVDACHPEGSQAAEESAFPPSRPRFATKTAMEHSG